MVTTPVVTSKEFHDFVVEWGGCAFTDFAPDCAKLEVGFTQHFGLIWSADQVNDLMETYINLPDEDRVDYCAQDKRDAHWSPWR